MFTPSFDTLFTQSKTSLIPVIITNSVDLTTLDDFQKTWFQQFGYSTKLTTDDYLIIPNASGKIDKVLVGNNPDEFLFTLGKAYEMLPTGNYFIQGHDNPAQQSELLLGYALGAYRFDKYKTQESKAIHFFIPEPVDYAALQGSIISHYLVRDLINEPANKLNPDTFSSCIRSIFHEDNVTLNEWIGHELIEHNFPLIYTVGKASDYQPRLIEINQHKNDQYPNITLVGKGVCFDTGGLDLKPSSGMRLMQKDMGGAAHMIGLTKWLVHSNLPLNLRLLLPIVENSVSGNAMRPGDIVKARNGMTVEIDNTDAEGRLILADALAYATETPYDLLIDFATLTGAARVALGPEIPALFTHHHEFAQLAMISGSEHSDPLCQLPLHYGYKNWVRSKHADIQNSSTYPFAGAITAALFLNEFVPPSKAPYVHIDLMAWNIRKRSGRPEGGEAMGLRAIYYAIKSFIE